MASARLFRNYRLVFTGLIAVGLALPVAPAIADPPDWAPAHGWRHHHDGDERGAVIVQPPPAYAVPAPPVACGGTQTSEIMGALAGAAAGGLVGSKFGKGSGKMATTGAGVAAGALVGDQVGRSLGGC